jgi:hypothetical protein
VGAERDQRDDQGNEHAKHCSGEGDRECPAAIARAKLHRFHSLFS